jgi:hypothetical protein
MYTTKSRVVIITEAKPVLKYFEINIPGPKDAASEFRRHRMIRIGKSKNETCTLLAEGGRAFDEDASTLMSNLIWSRPRLRLVNVPISLVLTLVFMKSDFRYLQMAGYRFLRVINVNRSDLIQA